MSEWEMLSKILEDARKKLYKLCGTLTDHEVEQAAVGIIKELWRLDQDYTPNGDDSED